MTLSERLAHLSSRAGAIQKSKVQTGARLLIGQRKAELDESTVAIGRAIVSLQWLATRPTAQDPCVADARKASEALSTIRSKVVVAGSIDVVTQNQNWKRCCALLIRTGASLEGKARGAWRSYVSTLGDFRSSGELWSQLAPTPENERAMNQYGKVYAQYKAVADLTLPHSMADVEKLKSLAEGCAEAFAQLDFGVPEDVAVFLRAVASPTGASLVMFTDGVREWIAGNQLANRYVIRLRA